MVVRQNSTTEQAIATKKCLKNYGNEYNFFLHFAKHINWLNIIILLTESHYQNHLNLVYNFDKMAPQKRTQDP